MWTCNVFEVEPIPIVGYLASCPKTMIASGDLSACEEVRSRCPSLIDARHDGDIGDAVHFKPVAFDIGMLE